MWQLRPKGDMEWMGQRDLRPKGAMFQGSLSAQAWEVYKPGSGAWVGAMVSDHKKQGNLPQHIFETPRSTAICLIVSCV